MEAFPLVDIKDVKLLSSVFFRVGKSTAITEKDRDILIRTLWWKARWKGPVDQAPSAGRSATA